MIIIKQFYKIILHRKCFNRNIFDVITTRLSRAVLLKLFEAFPTFPQAFFEVFSVAFPEAFPKIVPRVFLEPFPETFPKVFLERLSKELPEVFLRHSLACCFPFISYLYSVLKICVSKSAWEIFHF